MEIQNEIDKLLTLKESFSKIAGSYSSLVPKEFVTIQLHAENTDLSAYKVKVVNTTSGNEEFYDISASGYTEFEVKYDSVYEIVFPIIGKYITPATRTFTAQKPMRKIEASYVMAGVFGLDEQGNRYSLEQIEALEDKSIIKYGGYTDYDLENVQKADGTYGCGFMWEINGEIFTALTYATKNVLFDENLVPSIPNETVALEYLNGKDYTNALLSESIKLGVNVPAAELANRHSVSIKGNIYKGFLYSAGQYLKLAAQNTIINLLYSILGVESLTFGRNEITSNQNGATYAVVGKNTKEVNESHLQKIRTQYGTSLTHVMIVYDLPK